MTHPLRALYLHIPFCHSICPFCAFAVHQHRAELRTDYLAALRRELALRAASLPVAAEGMDSVYVGGGTPSTLPPDEVAALLDWVRRHLPLHPAAEVAFEVNPEDCTPDYVAGLMQAGVTRVSLGLQSLDGATLRALGRSHTAEQSHEAAAALRRVPGLNHNLDLMSGAPHVGPEPFQQDVTTVAGWQPPHLSLYGLDVEEGTLFARDTAVRNWVAGHREEQAALYLWASETLTAAGYRHYEVSNFCLPQQEGRQNLRVWGGEPYLGCGVGAHSYDGERRWYNERHIRPYQRALGADTLPVAHQEQLSREQRANEALMLALRRDTGLDLVRWREQHGVAWSPQQEGIPERLVAQGQATWDGTRLALTPRGFLVADGIAAALMV